MGESVRTRLKHAWNVFRARDETADLLDHPANTVYGTSINPTRLKVTGSNERSIVAAIYSRIAIDVSLFDIQHVRTDVNGRFIEVINSALQNCLTIEANKDQTGRAFISDVVMSLFDEGVVAVVPVDTTVDPTPSGAYEINVLRTAKILEWFPDHVRVEIYNDQIGRREKKLLPKSIVGIIENPLYAVMNEPNSTLKRLIRKLNLLDAIDEQSGSGKLDLLIQLPYTVKSKLRQEQAEQRRQEIEDQLTGSRYGIAYIDGTERVTQLNRPSENNLLGQITYLTSMLYNQLGITENVFNGNASDREMTNYYNRTVEPIVTAIIEEFRRKFLTKTARTQGQTIMGFYDVFRLMPAKEIAEMSDGLTRNEIVTSNEIRSVLRMKPATDPGADELRNKNMPAGDTASAKATQGAVDTTEYDKLIVETLAGIENDIDDILGGV